MNQKDADEWYPMEPIAPKMSKKKRIALLEKQVADLQQRILALEAQQTAPIPAVSPYPWTQHWTCDSTGNPPPNVPTVICSDLGDVPKEWTVSKGWTGVRVTKDERSADGSIVWEAEIPGTSVMRNGHKEPAILGP